MRRSQAWRRSAAPGLDLSQGGRLFSQARQSDGGAWPACGSQQTHLPSREGRRTPLGKVPGETAPARGGWRPHNPFTPSTPPPALSTKPLQEKQTAQRRSQEDGEGTEVGPLPALKPQGSGACTHTHTHPPLPAEGNKRHRVGVDSGEEAPLGHSCWGELGCLKTQRSQGLKPRGLWI